jgi:hypothetical protein
VLGDERLNVFFGDATAQTGARNFGQVDVIIFGDAAHQRAGANAFLLSLGIFQNCALLRSLQAFLFVGRKICRDLVCQLGFRRFGAGRFRRFGGRGFAGISCSRGLGWRWSGRRSARRFAFAGNRPHHGVHLDGGSRLHFDVLQGAGSGCGNLGVNLVGRDFKQRLIALNFFARLLQPFGNGPFKNRFPHLGHDYVSRHVVLPWDFWLELKAAASPSLYRDQTAGKVRPHAAGLAQFRTGHLQNARTSQTR